MLLKWIIESIPAGNLCYSGLVAVRKQERMVLKVKLWVALSSDGDVWGECVLERWMYCPSLGSWGRLQWRRERLYEVIRGWIWVLIVRIKGRDYARYMTKGRLINFVPDLDIDQRVEWPWFRLRVWWQEEWMALITEIRMRKRGTFKFFLRW